MIFITLTTSGYIEYTLNCLKSLDKIGLSGRLHTYCIGREGYEILKKNGYPCEWIDNEEYSEFVSFYAPRWSNVTYHKFLILHENLKKHDYVCITDGDIVFENPDFLSYLSENIGDRDLLIQSDSISEESDENGLCSGFMFLRSNPVTLAVFDPKVMESQKDNQTWEDQQYINHVKHSLNYKRLPLHLFPNGQYYYEYHASIKPYLIHFNWVVGHEKKKKMKAYKKWSVKHITPV
jgi:hypothetical protein